MSEQNTNIKGNVHSIETCGTVDGPGIRFVIFMQGCPMRCLYCHNPDSWDYKENKILTVLDILKEYESVKEFCKGGITVTGGEPLVQADFVAELFKQAADRDIHTALDTSGVLFSAENKSNYDKLLKYTNLVLLDIKHIDDEEHKKLTGHSNRNILEFAKYLSEINKPVWIRHVTVPTLTYNNEYLEKLGEFIGTLNNVKALDVLPYHDMAIEKYNKLGIDYPLKDIPPLSKEEAINARNIILNSYKTIKLQPSQS